MNGAVLAARIMLEQYIVHRLEPLKKFLYFILFYFFNRVSGGSN
jgi:hypothetical protein